jgi:hypothetical protein
MHMDERKKIKITFEAGISLYVKSILTKTQKQQRL